MSVKIASGPIKTEKLHFDKVTLTRDLEGKEEYKEENVIIKKWDGDE